MLKTIERLRQKSPTQKKRIAFLSALSFSGIIFVIWLSVVYPGFKERSEREANIKNTEVGPFSTFSDIFSSTFISIDGEIQKIKTMFSGSGDSGLYVSNSFDDKFLAATSSETVNDSYASSTKTE